MRYRSVTAIAFVLLLVGASGCSALQSGGGQAAEIRDQSTSAMQEVSSYNFTMDMSMQAQQGRTLDLSSTGTIDLENREMYMEMSFLGQDVTQYIVGNTQYIHVMDQWQQQDISDQNIWDQQNQLQQQRQIFESGEVSLEGNTTIDGEQVYEVSVQPDPSEVEDIVRQNQGQGAAQFSVEDVSYTIYVRHSDYLLKRVEADMTLSVRNQQADAQFTMTFSDYGIDPNIQVPQDAQDAPTMSGSA